MTIMEDRLLRITPLIIAIALAVSCATPPSATDPTPQPATTPRAATESVQVTPAATATPADPDRDVRTEPAPGYKENKGISIKMGSGVFVQEATAGGKPADIDMAAKGDVTLNFDQANLREFVRVVFEDILHENYLIDPQVKGEVTVHTTYPITRDAVLPILESVLEQNGAALVRDRGIYKIVPLADAEGGGVSPTIGSQSESRGEGYGVQIIPLRHVAASEMEKILKPFLPKGSTLGIDETRNLLVLSGPRYRLDQLMETVRIFDVDWLKGVSFGLFPLTYADAGTLVTELQDAIGGTGKGLQAGVVRLMPVERLNAVLVITTQPKYMKDIRELIEQFDQGLDGAPGQHLYVYYLKNGKAEKLASILQQLYGLGVGSTRPSQSAGIQQLMPGQSVNAFQTAQALSSLPPSVGAEGAGGDYPKPYQYPPAELGGTSAGGETEAGLSRNINIIADQDNNALLIMASPDDYRSLESAIRRLDIPQRQVLIDATIAEVTLSKGLDFGVRWFLEKNNLRLGFNAPVPATPAGEGLALALFKDSGSARLFIDALATRTSVKFLSAPQVMVLDNQTASIRVGDQIPVTVRTSQSTTDPDAPIVSEVQFRDTGTLLSVTPRINSGGQVTLNISQEVSLPGTEPATGGGGNVAISQRSIDSSVIIQSGETVVLGGLILETRNDGRSGIPILMDLPLIGKLFTTTSEDVFRTELIVMITPQVVEDETVARDVTEELRQRMQKATDYERSVKGARI